MLTTRIDLKSVKLLSLLILLAGPTWGAIIADHAGVAAFDQIPVAQFNDIRANYNFFYGHTSHGSQIMTGLNMLVDEDPALYARPTFREISDDLGHNGDTNWVQPTRDWLDVHPECNLVMWSWCGGCSDNTEAGISIYLAAMEGLEAEYPQVTGTTAWPTTRCSSTSPTSRVGIRTAITIPTKPTPATGAPTGARRIPAPGAIPVRIHTASIAASRERASGG